MQTKLKKIFKENWKFLVFLVLFYTFMNYQLPYVVYTPGGSIKMTDRIKGENTYKETGSFSMTYVSMVKGSIPYLALSYIIPNWDIVSTKEITYDEDKDLKKTIAIDKILMRETISNAELIAYQYAGIDYDTIKSENTITYTDKNAKTKLKYGDILLSVDNIEFDNIKEIQEYLKDKSVGDTVTIKYIRNDKEYDDTAELIDIGGNAKLGISMAKINEYDTPYHIEVLTKSSESGPSGGLITALEIYNQITESDLTKGKKIMGTGTMEYDGTVGEIGGVKYKLIGAVKKGAEVFICPEENYEEAQKIKDDNNFKIELIKAHTFIDAVSALENLN